MFREINLKFKGTKRPIGRTMAKSVSRRPLTEYGQGSVSGKFVWDLWWAMWHWDMFISEYFSITVSVPLHQCSIQRIHHQHYILPMESVVKLKNRTYYKSYVTLLISKFVQQQTQQLQLPMLRCC
jgi:hypothetical protein